MSRYANHRTDGYGGDLAGRMRFPLEVLEAVDGAIAPEAVLGIRVSADELVPDGMTIDDVIEAVDYLRSRVRLDYLSVSLGNYTTHENIVPDHSFPPAFNAGRAKRLRDSLSPIPVLVSGRIRDAADARKVIEGGFADMVGVARGLIADPRWAEIALAGGQTQVRPCIYCNEDCRTNVGKSLPLACSVNPRIGSEDEVPPSAATPAPRTVLVVGGGPAGITAALRARALGMSVVLAEAADALGGQLAVSSRDSRREELVSYLDYLRAEVRRSGIEVRLSERLTAGQAAAGFNAVVAAVGAVQRCRAGPRPPRGRRAGHS